MKSIDRFIPSYKSPSGYNMMPLPCCLKLLNSPKYFAPPDECYI